MDPQADAPEPLPAAGTPSVEKSDAGLLGYSSGAQFPAGAGPESDVFGDGGTLIARNGTTLPAACVLCGAAALEAPIRLTFSWDSSFRRTKISTLELRQKAHVFGYLCAAHRRTWSRARRLGAVGATAGSMIMLAGMAIGVWSESSDVPRYTPLGITLTIAGFAVVTASMFYFTLRSRTLSCQRIQEGYLYLEGAAQGLMAGLPPLPKPAAPKTVG